MTNRLMAQNNQIIKLKSKCKDDHPPTQLNGWQKILLNIVQDYDYRNAK